MFQHGRVILTALVIAQAPWAVASQLPASPTGTGAASDQFRPEELDQMLATIALYPDDLLSQVLMGATYPLEVVQADRWRKDNEGLTGDALAKALEAQPWDPSVKSLVNFPQVLGMMSAQLDWTSKLGDAFIGQQSDVMDAVQRLRAKAHAQGNLKSTPQQTVVVQEQGPAPTIVIEPAQPQTIYVPTYEPTVVYGGWPYPEYPPAPVYPAGYVATAALSFGAGVACGAAWGYAWGHWDWNHHGIDIDVNRNAIFNQQINRDMYRNNFNRNNMNVVNGRGAWRHDVAHRGGVPYRNASAARRYGGPSSADAARARESFRGRPTDGRFGQGDNRFGQGGGRDMRPGDNRPTPHDRAGNRPGGADRGGQRPQSLDRGHAGDRGGSFSGIDRGGASARQHSDRGRMSRDGSSQRGSRSMGGGGGSRGGSRGSRGGGGGRGGRGGGGGRRR